MPFTVSHVAAVVPFRRTRLVFSALVVGSMAPDFEYFVHLAPTGRATHFFPGMVTFALPAALAVLWLWEAFLERGAVALLPRAFERRIAMEPFRWGGLTRFLNIVLSLQIGIFTHVLWDSFTHRSGWAYRHWAWLRKTTEIPGIGDRAQFQLMQAGSTVLGLAVLAIIIYLWFRRTPPRRDASGWTDARRIAIVAVMSAVALAGGLLRAKIGIPHPQNPFQWDVIVVMAVVSTMTFFTLQVLTLGVWRILTTEDTENTENTEKQNDSISVSL